MSRIPTPAERELQGLSPTGLDGDFLDRLAACAEGTFTELTPAETEFEARLRAIRPKALPAALTESLIGSLGDTPFAVDGKILLFHKAALAGTGNRKILPFRARNFAAAAAVALTGALAALMAPGIKPAAAPVAANDPAPETRQAPLAPANPNLAPVGFGNMPSETRDEGVIWRGKNQPHRVLRLTYREHIVTKDAQGKPVSLVRPRVEYMIVPEKVD